MGVSHKHRLCFVHIPKTAGMSIQTALEMRECQHAQSSYWRRRYPHYKRFTVIRGSIDRQESAYNYHNKNFMDIKNLPESRRVQSLPIDYWLDEPVDYLLRWERLEEDFNSMLLDNLKSYQPLDSTVELRSFAIALPHLNKT